MRRLFLNVVAAVAVMSATNLLAHADTIVNNTSLSNPPTPAVYYGSGNSGTNFGWTVNHTSGGVEIGLQAIIRQVGPITPVGDLYHAPKGLQPSHPSFDVAAWNYVFSINLNGNTLGLVDLNDIKTNTTITVLDENTNLSISYNPFAVLSDNATTTTTGPVTQNNTYTGKIAVQNSENLLFSFTKPPGYDVNAADTYRITLDVQSGNVLGAGTEVGTDVIEVSTAPLPSVASLGALMMGVAGFGVFFRTRNARKLA